jgi:hypothetical protein
MDLAGSALDYTITFVERNWLFVAAVVVAIAIPWRLPRLRFQLPDRVVCMTVISLSLLVSIGAAALHGVPLPRFHDDFSYLLSADLVAHGRAADPPHALWPHFETMHVLQQPRYASKFPPGQGIILALGRLLFRVPLAGAWLICAAACAAIWWALRVWISPQWAMLGGIAAAIHPTMLRWSETYHGGGLAAFGGALLVGAAGRLIQAPSWRASAIAGLALALLAISRPYEGLVFAVAMLAIVLIAGNVRAMLAASPAGLLVIVIALAMLGLYNRSITGSATTLPYLVYERQYDPVPNFLWEQPRPMPKYRNPEMAYVYRVAYWGHYRRLFEPGGFSAEVLKKIDVIRFTLFGTPAKPFDSAWLLLPLPLIALPRVLRRNATARMLSLALVIFAFAPFSITWWLEMHYLAPAAAAAAGLIILLISELYLLWPKRGTGAALATMVLLAFLANATVQLIAFVRTPDSGFEPLRQRMVASLMAKGSQHLVVVMPEVFDAVYNGADIDHQPIVWARDLGGDSIPRLRAYFRNRTMWRLSRRNDVTVLEALR